MRRLLAALRRRFVSVRPSPGFTYHEGFSEPDGAITLGSPSDDPAEQEIHELFSCWLTHRLRSAQTCQPDKTVQPKSGGAES